MKNFFLKFILLSIIITLGRNVYASASNISGKKTEYQVPILVYHSIGPVQNKKGLQLKETKTQAHYRVNTEMFEKQMKYFSDNGYHPISFATYVNSLKDDTKLPEKTVVLTFDDGWKTQYKYAVPILEKYNFTATFFIVTSYINGNYNAYMNWDNLKDLVAHNFDIESHTENHLILTKINSQKLITELTDSKKTLEDKLAIKVIALAYPNYVQNQNVRDVVKSSGYIGARAGWTKFNNSIDYIYQLKSQEVVNNSNPFSSKRLPDLP